MVGKQLMKKIFLDFSLLGYFLYVQDFSTNPKNKSNLKMQIQKTAKTITTNSRNINFAMSLLVLDFYLYLLGYLRTKNLKDLQLNMIFPVWVILMLFQPLLAWQLVLHFSILPCVPQKTSKNIQSNANFHFIAPKSKNRNQKRKSRIC